MASHQPLPPEQYVAGQEALATLVVAQTARAWPLLDVHAIRDSLPRLSVAVQAIIAKFGPASSAAAVQHYVAQRSAAGVPGRVAPKLAPAPTPAAVEKVVSGAVSTLFGTVTPQDEQAALQALGAEVEKLVLDQSRQTTLGMVAGDRQAKWWARVPQPGACSFCLMLASRGAVYSSPQAAGRRDAAARWADAKGYTNSFHPSCRCVVEPVFGVYEPTAQVRQAQALWRTSTRGLSGADARKAFRRAVEGRTGGPTRAQKPAK